MRPNDRKDCDEWPQNNESWAEFMVRKDAENKTEPKVAIILACLILLPIVAWMTVEALDKVFS